MTPNPEIGRKLTAEELKPKTVVILRRGMKAGTFWVRNAGPVLVEFYANPRTGTQYHLFLKVRHDGTLTDDTNQEVEVYEYLGKV